jgi:acylphosphatase
MKLKITITGPKVHGVGYRYFLMDTALDLGLQGFSARNRIENGRQQVVAFIDGDGDAVSDFRSIAEATKLENAEVSSIDCSSYEGTVMDIGSYAQTCTAHQLNKAIPILRDIKANTAPTPQILEEIKGLRDDQPNPAIRQSQLDMAAVKARLNIP